MKYLVMFISLIILGCSKSGNVCSYEESFANYGNSISETNINGWKESKCSFSRNKSISSINISMEQWTNNCNLLKLIIADIPCKIDSISLRIDTSKQFPPTSFKILDGGDAVADRWELIDGGQNWVSITSINKDSTEINGNFNLSFVLTAESLKDGKYDVNLSDSLYFKNGTFTSKAIK